MGVDLVGVDLAGVDLVGVDLAGVDLVGVDLKAPNRERRRHDDSSTQLVHLVPDRVRNTPYYVLQIFPGDLGLKEISYIQ